jgi:hypothetical protein
MLDHIVEILCTNGFTYLKCIDQREWPAYLPECNPIEHIWNALQVIARQVPWLFRAVNIANEE